MEKKRLMFMVALLMVACHVFADKYKVLYVNSTGIKIEKKNAAVGSIFSDKDKIVWTDDQQAMKVVNINTNRVIVLAAKALKKKKSSSLYEYLTSTKRLSTRDLKNRNKMEEWQIDSIIYLLDTLYVRIPQNNVGNVEANMICKEGIVKVIPLPTNDNYYIITKDLFNHQFSQQVRIDIREFDKKRNWEYTTYRNLIIELIE